MGRYRRKKRGRERKGEEEEEEAEAEAVAPGLGAEGGAPVLSGAGAMAEEASSWIPR